MIYLDNSATSFHKPAAVIEAVAAAMTGLGNAGRGGNGVSLETSRMIYRTREKLSAFLGVGNPARVAFTANATEALNTAVFGLFSKEEIMAGKVHVITTALEHNSVLRPLYVLMEQGLKVTILPCDDKGNISYEEMEEAVTADTKAIICTHASNVTGNVVDIDKVGKIAGKHHLHFILDASQSAGILPISMKDTGIDVLCFSGHKGMLGPQGTGAVCVAEGVELCPLKVGGSGIRTFDKSHPGEMPTALEAGTLNAHGIAGLEAAVDYLNKTGIQRIHEKEIHLMDLFYKGVKEIPGVKIYGNFVESKNRVGIVSLNIRDLDSGTVSDWLMEDYGICTRSGGHCAPLVHEAMGTAGQGMVRFSFSHFNTEEEVYEAVQAVRELAE